MTARNLVVIMINVAKRWDCSQRVSDAQRCEQFATQILLAAYFETRSFPNSLFAYPGDFTLITRTACACASYPSCVAVYPRDSQSRRVLCRSTPVGSIREQGVFARHGE